MALLREVHFGSRHHCCARHRTAVRATPAPVTDATDEGSALQLRTPGAHRRCAHAPRLNAPMDIWLGQE